MKKLLFFLLPALMLAGCKPGEENTPEPAGLSIEPQLITCPDAGGDYTIELTSPNGAWSATSNESWIRITPTSGEKGTAEVRIKISPNKESAETKGIITFTSDEETVSFPVTRAAKAAPYLRVVSEKELNTPKEGGTYTVQVESNIKWSISSNTGWAKVNKGVSVNNDNITVTVSPATYGEGEAAGTQQVTITRGSTEATSLSVDPTEINAPETGGSFTVNVSSNAKWRVWKTWDMDWLTLSGSQDGDGNGSFSFSIEEATSMDAVSGILTIEEDRSDNYKPVVTQVAVSRKGKAAADLTVAPIAINAPAEGGHFPVAVKSNYSWTATTSGNFFSLSSTSGDGYSTIVVSVSPASDINEATGFIIITTSFGNESARINIKREGKETEPEGTYVMRPFSVSETKQVYFAPGNLQYRASSAAYRFAPHQYDYIGAENVNISSTYSGWIDLFGWGTGYNPTFASVDDHDYTSFTDWGVNSIRYGNTVYGAHSWRTLTVDELEYLMQRKKSGTTMFLFGMAKVNGVLGLVLLPDDWVFSSELVFIAGTFVAGNYIVMKEVLETNNYTFEQWQEMEAKGAVFLPAAGDRLNGEVKYVSTTGCYWTSTSGFDTPTNLYAKQLMFFSSATEISIFPANSVRDDGCSVRLVQDIN